MRKLYYLFLAALLGSCSLKLTEHVFPTAVDTTTRPISYQGKKVYKLDGIKATNDFPSGRLNDFIQLNDSTFQGTILSENEPINPSPWYAFQISSEVARTIYVKLVYPEHFHRYDPKTSKDGETWTILDTTLITYGEKRADATMKLEVGPEVLWVAAQEIEDHRRVGEWVNKMAEHSAVKEGTAGKSVQGRSMYYMNIGEGEERKKPIVAIISRQHPPEVTGYLAMKPFVETIIEEGSQNGFLDKFRVIVYPLMNPDGVDLGHYRHNTGGIDMNRDWAFYHQPEVKQVASHMVAQARENKSKIVLGLDFHSTYKDVYYTNDETLKSHIPGFTKDWLAQIQTALELDDINEKPSGLGAPVSKGWFFQQFQAEGITYEIGDETPRDFIKTKGEVSAKAMMNVLMARAKEWGL